MLRLVGDNNNKILILYAADGDALVACVYRFRSDWLCWRRLFTGVVVEGGGPMNTITVTIEVSSEYLFPTADRRKETSNLGLVQ